MDDIMKLTQDQIANFDQHFGNQELESNQDWTYDNEDAIMAYIEVKVNEAANNPIIFANNKALVKAAAAALWVIGFEAEDLGVDDEDTLYALLA